MGGAVSFGFDVGEPIADQSSLPAVEPDTLLDLPLRVWVELGRTAMPAALIVGMAPGTIVDLERLPEDPADIYVNGRYFGAGRLLLVDGEWAIRIESIEPHTITDSRDEPPGAYQAATPTTVEPDRPLDAGEPVPIAADESVPSDADELVEALDADELVEPPAGDEQLEPRAGDIEQMSSDGSAG